MRIALSSFLKAFLIVYPDCAIGGIPYSFLSPQGFSYGSKNRLGHPDRPPAQIAGAGVWADNAAASRAQCAFALTKVRDFALVRRPTFNASWVFPKSGPGLNSPNALEVGTKRSRPQLPRSLTPEVGTTLSRARVVLRNAPPRP